MLFNQTSLKEVTHCLFSPTVPKSLGPGFWQSLTRKGNWRGKPGQKACLRAFPFSVGLHSKQPVLEASFAGVELGQSGPAEGLFGWGSLVTTRCSPCRNNSQGVPSFSCPGLRVRIARYGHPPPLKHRILQSPAPPPPRICIFPLDAPHKLVRLPAHCVPTGQQRRY